MMGINKAFTRTAVIIALFCVADFCTDGALAARRRSSTPSSDYFELLESGRPSRTSSRRTAGKDQDTAADAAYDIASKLVAVLQQVNTGGKLSPKEIDVVNQTLRNTRKHVTNFSGQEKCDYYLLSAWCSYFEGQYKTAMIQASKAAKEDEENQDAKATHIAMSLINGQLKVVTKMAGKPSQNTIFGQDSTRSSARRRRSSRMPMSMGMGSRSAGATLDFDPDALQYALFAKKLSKMQLHCLNASTFVFDPDQTALCLMFWKLPSEEDNETFIRPRSIDPFSSGPLSMMGAPPMTPRSKTRSRRSRRGRQDDSSIEMDAFCDLFLDRFENANVRFLGANTDDIETRPDVMESLMENPWPWAQVMATDPANSALEKFASLDFKQPALAIVAPGGLITYAGPATGFLPALLIDYYTSNNQTQPAVVEEQPNRDQPSLFAASDANDISSVFESKPAAAVRPPAGGLGAEEELNPQADEWYQLALAFSKQGGVLPTIKYGNMVRYCRLILENYPETSYAEKARQMLREIPERYRSRYKITDKEMGL